MSVDAVINARIGSLASAERELLEKASTLGGTFWLGSLVALSRIDASAPDLWGGQESLGHYTELLSALTKRDFVLPLVHSSIPGEIDYAFKHDRERQTLQEMTNISKMRRYHRAIADWLEFKLSSRDEAQLEMLAITMMKED